MSKQTYLFNLHKLEVYCRHAEHAKLVCFVLFFCYSCIFLFVFCSFLILCFVNS